MPSEDFLSKTAQLALKWMDIVNNFGEK